MEFNVKIINILIKSLMMKFIECRTWEVWWPDG